MLQKCIYVYIKATTFSLQHLSNLSGVWWNEVWLSQQHDTSCIKTWTSDPRWQHDAARGGWSSKTENIQSFYLYFSPRVLTLPAPYFQLIFTQSSISQKSNRYTSCLLTEVFSKIHWETDTSFGPFKAGLASSVSLSTDSTSCFNVYVPSSDSV